jgi:pyruvate-formate lyase-activating enzyme
VPDLLFEDEQEARLADLGALVERPERLDAKTPLHRLTVFLTYRCNLDCPYCKTIHLPRQRAFDEAQFAALLAQHTGTPLRHVHFTGGEASLVPGLEAMVRRAKEAGVEQTSLTTNGTLSAERYLALVRAGLDELRVSIDAADPTLGAQLTGRPHAWSRAMETLRALGQARREGAAFFLIVNTVVGVKNRAQLPALVRTFLALGVDDVKLITEVDARGTLGEFDGVEAVRSELASLEPGLPLLRKKLQTVFAPDAIGLDAGPARVGWRCYVPLTERTVDGDAYYPCSVYLREGGAPLGLLTDSPALQREKSARFTREADCTVDPICRRYCLHCTRSWNDRVARAGLAKWLEALDALAPTLRFQSATHLIVTPLGLPQRERILSLLRALRLAPQRCTPLTRWSRVSTALQVRARDVVALTRAELFERLWREHCPADVAELWTFSREAHALLSSHKRALRAELDNRHVDVPELSRPASLHALHLADVDEVDAEGARLHAARALLG